MDDWIPKEMKVGGVDYEILDFCPVKKVVSSDVMVDWSEAVNAKLGDRDGEHILRHQTDISAVFRGKVVFFFMNWRRSERPSSIYCVFWNYDRWISHCYFLFDGLTNNYRVLRRKSDILTNLRGIAGKPIC